MKAEEPSTEFKYRGPIEALPFYLNSHECGHRHFGRRVTRIVSFNSSLMNLHHYVNLLNSDILTESYSRSPKNKIGQEGIDR
ncbi:hypothetical protein SeMB42_g05660 [Synchytrium endobioticum]|uniref:Uncharacterized protein n=1 Tax=Synchytrium endobioticum TaxID=286115 RepID=A0A507CQ71_9FUNG|nr:hypothetical protein SeMB42_g05660 [Synchytrium endobioticum]